MVFMIRNALITGASSGIGRSIALELGQYCPSLALHYHRNLDEAKSLQEALSSKNCRTKLFCYDLTNSEKARVMVSQAADPTPRDCRNRSLAAL
jgi:3-oxoacyl-[acyl-carrier protein] reductase